MISKLTSHHQTIQNVRHDVKTYVMTSNFSFKTCIIHVKRQILTYFPWRHFSVHSSFIVLSHRVFIFMFQFLRYNRTFKTPMSHLCDIDLWPVKVKLLWWSVPCLPGTLTFNNVVNGPIFKIGSQIGIIFLPNEYWHWLSTKITSFQHCSGSGSWPLIFQCELWCLDAWNIICIWSSFWDMKTWNLNKNPIYS